MSESISSQKPGCAASILRCASSSTFSSFGRAAAHASSMVRYMTAAAVPAAANSLIGYAVTTLPPVVRTTRRIRSPALPMSRLNAFSTTH